MVILLEMSFLKVRRTCQMCYYKTILTVLALLIAFAIGMGTHKCPYLGGGKKYCHCTCTCIQKHVPAKKAEKCGCCEDCKCCDKCPCGKCPCKDKVCPKCPKKPCCPGKVCPKPQKCPKQFFHKKRCR